MTRKIIVLIAGLFSGFIFHMIGVPAGWLIGALLFGAVYGMMRQDVAYRGPLFKGALALIGANIGVLTERDVFLQVGSYIGPLLLTLILTFAGSFLLGWLLYKNADGMDAKTALFCTIPGGASEVIVTSREAGADERIVAAFHSFRIFFFVFTIPLIVGIGTPAASIAGNGDAGMTASLAAVILIAMAVAALLNRFFPLPAGILLYAIVIAFLLSEFLIPVESLPDYIGGVGQALIGVMIGVTFNPQVMKRLYGFGRICIYIIVLFLALGVLLAWLFHTVSGLNMMTSLLSIVPAGAPEMSATAFALNLDPTLVASLQIIRVLTILLMLPFLLKLIERMENRIEN
ncbi:AbrB family transcriptional regulator [Alkalicoccus luteus]|uniref:AbrB family transcriptional regulator n=1 Tax=Alkalicoccus luteus TaxID=1237094 RepID=A0A969PSM5_9BACI|nr:AbrB family transcriptional regulator [Alkalicoccus luteus]